MASVYGTKMVTASPAKMFVWRETSSAGTPKALANGVGYAPSSDDVLTHGVWIKLLDSSDIAWIDVRNTMDSDSGVKLLHGEEMFLPVNDATGIWFDTSNSNDELMCRAI